MPYWLYRNDDESLSVVSGRPMAGHESYPTELAAHEGAVRELLRHREVINKAIAHHRRAIRACKR